MAYTEEQIAEFKAAVCEQISEGKSLRVICEEDKSLPTARTIHRWLNDDEDFCQQYARAREAQADALFDEILEIADDGRNDWMERKDRDDQNIGWRENGEAIRRSQLRVDARKWMAAKLQPKKYGERLDLNHSGSVSMTKADIDAELAKYVTAAGGAEALAAALAGDEGKQA